VHSLFRAIVQHDSTIIILNVENISGSAYCACNYVILRSLNAIRSRHSVLHMSAHDVVGYVLSPEIKYDIIR
jgi:hypothetical protein